MKIQVRINYIGYITFHDLKKIIRNNLEFKISEKELEQLFRDENGGINSEENKIDEEKVNFDYLIRTVDTLKREKLFLVSLLNSLNYFIFALLMAMIILYINFFYKYN